MEDSEKKQTVRIELTPEQREQLRKELGSERDATAIEFDAQELEERIAPIEIF